MYFKHMAHRNTLLLIALFLWMAPHASADISYSFVSRQQQVWIDNAGRASIHAAGYEPYFLSNDLSMFRTNEHGTTSVKSTYEALTAERRIKHSADSLIRTQLGTPGESFTSSTYLSVHFNLDHETTFEFDYKTTDLSRDETALFYFRIWQGSTTELFIETDEASAGIVRITLAAGQHQLLSRTHLIRNTINNPGLVGNTSFHSDFEFRIVPTPSTLATLFAATLFTTRRRRV